MMTDRYTKAMLTVITVALIVVAMKPGSPGEQWLLRKAPEAASARRSSS